MKDSVLVLFFFSCFGDSFSADLEKKANCDAMGLDTHDVAESVY